MRNALAAIANLALATACVIATPNAHAWSMECHTDALTGKTSSCSATSPGGKLTNDPPELGSPWDDIIHGQMLRTSPWNIVFSCSRKSRTGRLVLIGYFPYVGYRGTGSARAIGDVDRDPVEWKVGIFTVGEPHIFQGTFMPNATAVEFVVRNTSMKFEFSLGDTYRPIMEFDATGATKAIREAREQCATL